MDQTLIEIKDALAGLARAQQLEEVRRDILQAVDVRLAVPHPAGKRTRIGSITSERDTSIGNEYGGGR